MKPHTLDHYILVLKNIIPEVLCNNILDEYNNSDEWTCHV